MANNLADFPQKVQFMENIRDLPPYICSDLGVSLVNETPMISIDPRV